jgi:hypothetical protein
MFQTINKFDGIIERISHRLICIQSINKLWKLLNIGIYNRDLANMKELPKKKFLLVLAKTFSDNKAKLLPRHSRKFMFNWLYQSSSRTREIHGRHLNANNWIYPIHEE